MNFVRLSGEHWPLAASVDQLRNGRLLSPPPYRKLVRDLSQQAVVLKARLCAADGEPRAQRVDAILRVDSQALDSFFNSNAGYRAQYYESKTMGEAANRLAVEAFIAMVSPVALAHKSRETAPTVARASLEAKDAKIWIYQGLWLRLAKLEDHVLRVPRWQEGLQSDEKRTRRLARWGSLAPASEWRIVLKGAFILDGEPASLGKASEARSHEIHALGFT
jgi:hypothetical protein